MGDLVSKIESLIAETVEKWLEGSRKTDSGCMEFVGAKSSTGYGSARFKGKTWRVHRLVLISKLGRDLRDKFACHTCDNRLCINPKHLFEGTAKENTLDAIQKGRRKPPPIRPDNRTAFGEKQGQSKLKNKDIPIIRKALKNGALGYVLAQRYGVAASTIGRIKNVKSWQRV